MPSAKALATVTLTQRATPFLYQGDELGMTNYPFTSIEEFDDVEVKGLWRTLVETGRVPAEELLSNLRQTSRDNARTPMQWSTRRQRRIHHRSAVVGGQLQLHRDQRAVPGGRPGFGLRTPPRADRVAPPSIPHWCSVPTGDIDPGHEQVFAYTRTSANTVLLVVVNMGSEPLDYQLPGGLAIARDTVEHRR